MSVVISGNPANITAPLTATITAMANNGSGAIRVTTSSAHFFGQGDIVRVRSTVPGANANWNVTIIDSTHFDLQGSSFTATGVGLATDLMLTPQVLCPSDGDSLSAQLSGLLSAFQGILDRTQYLQLQSVNASALDGQVDVSIAAQNWQPSITWPGSGPGPYAIASGISPGSTPQWLAAGLDSGHTNVLVYQGNGQDNSLSSTSFAPGVTLPSSPMLAMVSDVNGNVYVALPTNASTFLVFESVGGGSYSLVDTIPSSSSAQSIDLAVLAGSTIVYAAQASVSATSQLGTVAGGVGLSGITLANGPICRSNGSVVIATDRTQPGTFLYRSTNGLSWSTFLLSGLFGAGSSITDITWSGVLGQWLAVGFDGTNTAFWTSLDGQFWAKASTFGSHGVTGVAPFGIGWVATLALGTTSCQAIFSFDAITWYASGAFIGTGGVVSNFRMIGSIMGNQLMMSAINTTTTGQVPLRFSTTVGVPARHIV